MTHIDERSRAIEHSKKYLDKMQDGLGISQEGANIMANAFLAEVSRTEKLEAELAKRIDYKILIDDLAKRTFPGEIDSGDALIQKIKRLESALSVAEEALKCIYEMKDMTRLADCCVEKSCHINPESGSCSFQTGVHYGNSDRAGDAQQALAQIKQIRGDEK